MIIIPSLSPWFVGVYECMVKIMEKFLKPLSGRKLLFYEELRTIFIEVKLYNSVTVWILITILKLFNCK